MVRRYAEVLHVYREALRVRECHALFVTRPELILVYQPIPGTLRESAAEVGQTDHNAKTHEMTRCSLQSFPLSLWCAAHIWAPVPINASESRMATARSAVVQVVGHHTPTYLPIPLPISDLNSSWDSGGSMDAYDLGYGAYFDPPSAYVAMASQKPDAGQPPIEIACLTAGGHINFEDSR